MVVSYSASSEDWCPELDPGKVDREFVFFARQCKKYNPRALNSQLIDINPDVFIFCSQNEARGSALHTNVALVAKAAGYRLLKNKITSRAIYARIAVQSSVFVRFESPVSYVNGQEFIDESDGRTAVAQMLNLLTPGAGYEQYSLVNTFLPPPQGRPGTIYSKYPYPLYRREVLAKNARFLIHIRQEVERMPDLSTRKLIFLGDFDTEIRSEYSLTTNYNPDIDEMTELLGYLSDGNFRLKEEEITFPPTSNYDPTQDTHCDGTLNNDCYVPEAITGASGETTWAGRRAGWRDRILYSPGLTSSNYKTIEDRGLPIRSDHVPLMLLLDDTPFTNQDFGSPRRPRVKDRKKEERNARRRARAQFSSEQDM